MQVGGNQFDICLCRQGKRHVETYKAKRTGQKNSHHAPI